MVEASSKKRTMKIDSILSLLLKLKPEGISWVARPNKRKVKEKRSLWNGDEIYGEKMVISYKLKERRIIEMKRNQVGWNQRLIKKFGSWLQILKIPKNIDPIPIFIFSKK